MQEIGRTLIVVGIVLIAIGGFAVLLSRTGIPIGRLPGDIVYKSKNTSFYFPLVTCIILSIVFSLIVYLIGRFRQ